MADDIVILASGPDHLEKFAQACDGTHRYLQNMGAKLAPRKSWTSSTDKEAGRKLAGHTWMNLGQHIRVITNTKDLAAHINLAAHPRAPTLTSRLRGGTTIVRMIEKIPATGARTAGNIWVMVHPAALYGVETSQPNSSAFASYQVPIVDMLAGTRNNGDGIDPVSEIPVRRTIALRGNIAKDAEAKQKVEQIYGAYKETEHTATTTEDDHLADIKPAPPPWHKYLKGWKPKPRLHGPIGLLLESIKHVGAAMREKLAIRQ